MLDDLAKSLPRFEAYTKILHTPRLHSALRDVYDLYINFCISTAKFLENNTCCMIPLPSFQKVYQTDSIHRYVHTNALVVGRPKLSAH